MNYRNIPLDKFLNSSVLATSLFIGSGCRKTYKDYMYAPKEYKDKFLVKDCVVLSGAALGMLAFQGSTNKLLQSRIYKYNLIKYSRILSQSNMKKGIKDSIQLTTDIAKDLISGVTASAAGIAGALGMDSLYELCNPKDIEYKYIPEKQDKMSKFVDKNLSKVADKDTRNALYSSVSDLPIISSGLLGANAIDIAKNKEFKKRLKHSTGYLINDTLVPLIFLTVSSALTKTMKPIKRIPLVFLSLFGGTLATRKIVDYFNKQSD